MMLFSSRLDVGPLLCSGRTKIHQVVITNRKGQRIHESLIVKEVPCSEYTWNEVFVLSQLKHKNIIRYRGYEKNGENLIMFLEKAHGGDLHDQVLRYGALPEYIARLLFSQVVKAVRFLHSRNLAHRDIKLENCLLMEKICELEQLGKARVKLADFEFACECNTEQRSQEPVGTENYQSPELLNGDYSAQKADIWALGIFLYVLVCGRFPSMIQAFLTEEEVPENLSLELKSLLMNILGSQEDERPSIDEIKRHKWIHLQSPRLQKTDHRICCPEKPGWSHFHSSILVT